MSFEPGVGFRYTRLYADADGATHFEDVVAPGRQEGHTTVTDAIPLSAMIMRHVVHSEGDAVRHNAPRRQFIVHLEGAVEVEASDGERRRFGPGDLVLVEDVEGAGHVTQWIGEEAGRRVLFLALPNQ
jgi:hypothetical protein